MKISTRVKQKVKKVTKKFAGPKSQQTLSSNLIPIPQLYP
jgi:hypothetical protein